MNCNTAGSVMELLQKGRNRNKVRPVKLCLIQWRLWLFLKLWHLLGDFFVSKLRLFTQYSGTVVDTAYINVKKRVSCRQIWNVIIARLAILIDGIAPSRFSQWFPRRHFHRAFSSTPELWLSKCVLCQTTVSPWIYSGAKLVICRFRRGRELWQNGFLLLFALYLTDFVCPLVNYIEYEWSNRNY